MKPAQTLLLGAAAGLTGLAVSPAAAHPGHIGELAGHSHWIGLAAAAAAAALAAWVAAAAQGQQADDEAEEDGETGEEAAT